MSQTTTPTSTGSAPVEAVKTQDSVVMSTAARRVLAISRIVIGWLFLWPFLDKTFGLGYATPAEGAWIRGGSPTTGFLSHAEGPFAGIFQAMVPAAPVLDWIFMIGLLGIGLASILGIGLRIAAISGTVLLFLMYLAAFPTAGATNPIIDSHWIEALVLIIGAVTLAGDTWGLGKWWSTKVGNSILR